MDKNSKDVSKDLDIRPKNKKQLDDDFVKS